MITILKKTPATINGRDCMEVLVHDDNIMNCTCCDLCIYKTWDDWNGTFASCMDVHGCTTDVRNYFITQPL